MRPQREPFALLADRRFFCLFAAHLVSNLGDWLAYLALFGLAALERGANAVSLALLAAAAVLPLVLVAPLAGVFVDRWDLRRVLVGSDLLRAAIVVAMAFVPGVAALGVLVFLHQAVGCFFNPAQAAALPRIVDRSRLLAANALTTSAAHLSKLLGPAVAGALVAAWGARGCFFADGASFVFSAGALLALPRMPAVRSETPAVRGELRAAFQFLRRTRPVRSIVACVAWAMAGFGAFLAVVAVYARDHLGAGARAMGFLLALLGAGAVVGALLVARMARTASRPRASAAGLALGAAALATLAAGRGFGAASAGVFLLGAAAAVAIVPAQALVQEETPRALLGRVTSVAVAAIGLAQAAGMALAGPAVAWLGLARFLAGAAVWLGAGAMLAFAIGLASNAARRPA